MATKAILDISSDDIPIGVEFFNNFRADQDMIDGVLRNQASLSSDSLMGRIIELGVALDQYATKTISELAIRLVQAMIFDWRDHADIRETEIRFVDFIAGRSEDIVKVIHKTAEFLSQHAYVEGSEF